MNFFIFYKPYEICDLADKIKKIRSEGYINDTIYISPIITDNSKHFNNINDEISFFTNCIKYFINTNDDNIISTYLCIDHTNILENTFFNNNDELQNFNIKIFRAIKKLLKMSEIKNNLTSNKSIILCVNEEYYTNVLYKIDNIIEDNLHDIDELYRGDYIEDLDKKYNNRLGYVII